MSALPPPEGMTEEDYDSIHAAVVETVRGRWFLAEYARRSRVDEVQEMLAAIGRLEKAVTNGNALPPAADVSPHLRLLAQRADEIATRLLGIADDLRESGADPYLCDDLDAQVRAIVNLPKGKPCDPVTPRNVAIGPMIALEAPANPVPEPVRELPPIDLPTKEMTPVEFAVQAEPQSAGVALSPIEPEFSASPAPVLPRVSPFRVPQPGEDPRLSALSAMGNLSLREKLAFFS